MLVLIKGDNLTSAHFRYVQGLVEEGQKRYPEHTGTMELVVVFNGAQDGFSVTFGINSETRFGFCGLESNQVLEPDTDIDLWVHDYNPECRCFVVDPILDHTQHSRLGCI